MLESDGQADSEDGTRVAHERAGSVRVKATGADKPRLHETQPIVADFIVVIQRVADECDEFRVYPDESRDWASRRL